MCTISNIFGQSYILDPLPIWHKSSSKIPILPYTFTDKKKSPIFSRKTLAETEIMVRNYLANVLQHISNGTDLQKITSYDLVQIFNDDGKDETDRFAKPIQFDFECNKNEIEKYKLVNKYTVTSLLSI